MRKILIIGFFALLIGTQAQAQSSLAFRPALGVNFSRLDNDPGTFRTDVRLGYQGGADLQLGKRIYLQPGLFFFQNSWDLVSDSSLVQGENLKIKNVIGGVRIPVIIGYRFFDTAKQKIFNFRIFGGPSYSFITRTESKETPPQAIVPKNYFSDNIYGFNVGAGLDILVVCIDAGYEFGLNNFYTSPLITAKNRMFYVNVGIRMDLN